MKEFELVLLHELSNRKDCELEYIIQLNESFKQLTHKLFQPNLSPEQLKEAQTVLCQAQSKLLQFTINSLAHVSKLKANTVLPDAPNLKSPLEIAKSNSNAIDQIAYYF